MQVVDGTVTMETTFGKDILGEIIVIIGIGETDFGEIITGVMDTGILTISGTGTTGQMMMIIVADGGVTIIEDGASEMVFGKDAKKIDSLI